MHFWCDLSADPQLHAFSLSSAGGLILCAQVLLGFAHPLVPLAVIVNNLGCSRVGSLFGQRYSSVNRFRRSLDRAMLQDSRRSLNAIYNCGLVQHPNSMSLVYPDTHHRSTTSTWLSQIPLTLSDRTHLPGSHGRETLHAS